MMIPLPEAIRALTLPLCDLSGERILIEGERGRLWIIEFGSPMPRIRPTAVVLPSLLSATYRDDCRLLQWVGDRLLVEHEDNVQVLSLSTGSALLSLTNVNQGCETVCLTPDGSMLFVNCEDFTSIYRADDQARTFDLYRDPADSRTTVFNQPQLDCPESSLIVSIAGLARTCRLLIGCFHCIEDWVVEIGSQPENMRILGDRRTLWGFPADPVIIAAFVIYPLVFICGGGGTHLEAYNLETGDRSECPWPGPKLAYGSFRGLLSGRNNSLLVRTREGWIRWWPGDGRIAEICDNDFMLLGETEQGLWALRKDDPVYLMKVES